MLIDIHSPFITNISHDSNIHTISYISSKLSQYTQTQLTYSIFGQAIFGVSLFGYAITYGSLNYASNIHDRMFISSKIETTIPLYSIISEVV